MDFLIIAIVAGIAVYLGGVVIRLCVGYYELKEQLETIRDRQAAQTFTIDQIHDKLIDIEDELNG